MGVFVLVCFHSFEERVQSQRREVLASIYYSEGLNYIMRNSTCPFIICLKTAGGIVWEQNMQYESCAHHLLPCTLPLRRMSRRGTTYLLKKKKRGRKKKSSMHRIQGCSKRYYLRPCYLPPSSSILCKAFRYSLLLEIIICLMEKKQLDMQPHNKKIK